MRLGLVLAAALGLVAVPLALASRTGPEPYRRPHVPLHGRAAARGGARSAARRAGLLRRAPSNAVALTFDDGPGQYTRRLVAILRAAGARATFFVVGNRLQYWPGVVRAEETVGVVGDHSWSHAHLPQLPRWLGWLELARTQYAVSQELGHAPTLFRAPYEEHDPTLDATVALARARRGVLVGALRRRPAEGDGALGDRNVLAGLRPGAIVLMHDLHPWTREGAAADPATRSASGGCGRSRFRSCSRSTRPREHQGCPLAPGAD